MNWSTYDIELITPCFCAGADQTKAEIRVPSIRGQLRWWFRALGGTREQEKKVFGGVHGGAVASRVRFRIEHEHLRTDRARLLPHASEGGKARATRSAITKGSFVLKAICRNGDVQQQVDRTVKVWTLLGTLGARSNRAAGSVQLKDPSFQSLEKLGKYAAALKLPSAWDIQITKNSIAASENLRTVASDTKNDKRELFGFVQGKQRQASPIKMKVLRVGMGYHLLIFAPVSGLVQDALTCLQTKPNWQELQFIPLLGKA